MYTFRTYKPQTLLRFTYRKLIFLCLYAGLIVSLYVYADVQWLLIPWVPLGLVGIAVAFYMGFKNNSAHERTWEARKIWGAIVNASRSWGSMVNGFVTSQFTDEPITEEEIKTIRKRLIYRHIAWLYRLKRQLRVIKSWEHNARINKVYRKYINELFPTEDPEKELRNFLADEEVKEILSKKNGATQLINKQAEDLRDLRKRGVIEDFRHMEMQAMLNEFYTEQGKCERIKNFPLPRQYASISIYLFYIFILLMPLGLLSAFTDANLPKDMVWGVVPFTMLVGWIFYIMELVGDYAENPFENLAFDVPMTSLTRTIEIDLREMLGETELPAPIEPKDDFVM